ncbi:hypothetical protein SUDANB6_04093 [Streptomyces sp. enrichment culture]|uniref:PstS family phosphate ABC transporter substrate-binding protein n=1 Tax=Streptomyces sp. enrichment culture TaxID=1795815 RepID=UPI003F5458BA
MFESIADFLDGVSDGEMWAGGVICALSAALMAYWLDRYQGWRRISWSEVYNGPINKHITSRTSADMWEIHWQGRPILEGSLVIVEVRNSGVQTLEPEHFAAPLTFTFPGKKVVHFKVRDANAPLEATLRPQLPVPAADRRTDTIVLPLFTLNRRERFRLLVLLEDNGSGERPPKIVSGGKVKGGRVKRTAGRARRRWAAVIVLALVAASSLGTGVYAHNRSLELSATCSRGELRVTGSTAFSPHVHQVKEEYERRCSGAEVVLDASNSTEGLEKLEAHPTAEMIAMADIAPGGEPRQDFDAHRVGVLVYAVVAHRELAERLGPDLWRDGLSQEELARAYRGEAVDGVEVMAVTRDDGSGTRQSFEDEVIGPQETSDRDCTPGTTGVCSVATTMELLDYVNQNPNAIGYAEAGALPFFPNVRTVPINATHPTKENVLSGDYRFWAAEFLYTRKNATGLTRNFLDFFRSRGVSKLLDGQGFLPCRELEDARNEEARCGGG